jgi:hypothetical protein
VPAPIDNWFLVTAQSFTEVDKCTVKTQDILDAVAKQIKDETERVLNDDELANIASMIRTHAELRPFTTGAL